MWLDWLAPWATQRLAIKEGVDLGDRVLVLAEVTATFPGSTKGVKSVQVERGDFLEPLCLDPLVCEHRHGHASGPWTCAFNHPRVASEAEAA